MREEWKEFTKDSEKAMKEIKDTLADVGKDNRDNMVGWTVGGVIFGITLGVTVALVLLGYGISKAVDWHENETRLFGTVIKLNHE